MTPTLHLALLRRNFAVWLAVLITLFGALAPTVSHALVGSQGGNGAWTEICTSTGQRWVTLGLAQNDAPQSTGADAPAAQIQTDSPQPPASVLSLDHCPFCLLSTDRAAPPPHALVHLFAVTGGFKVPTVRQAFLFFPHFALTPPPRGPPASL
jgi:hypothetical protein